MLCIPPFDLSRRHSRAVAHWIISSALFAFAAACTAEKPAAMVSITSPAEGDTVRGTSVQVTLTSSGIEIAPAAEQRAGTAHHHLFLDVDVSGAGPIPAGMAGIVHLGKAETEYRFDSVAVGSHRIIAVLADPAHVPLQPFTADTVNFVVVPATVARVAATSRPAPGP